jgi:hypothetical protein
MITRERVIVRAIVSSRASAPGWTMPQLPPTGSIALVGCVKQKADHAAPAGELYTSTLFDRQRQWATSRCDRWFILSAKYGLVDPDAVIEPYELTLKALPRSAKQAWSERVLQQLKARLNGLQGRFVEIYAGRDYFDFGLREGLVRAGATVALPWEGLGLGQRMARTEYAKHG